MRWVAFFIAIFCLGAVAYRWNSSAPVESNSEGHFLEAILRSANQQAGQQIESRLQALGDMAVDMATRWQNKDKSYRELWAKPQAPRALWLNNKRIRVPDFAFTDSMNTALESFATVGKEKFSLQLIDEHYWFLLRSYYLGQPLVSVYPAETFWGALEAGQGIIQWIVSPTGQVLRHPTTRFLGENSANLRVVAKAAEELQQGHELARFEHFLALDGQELWGVWSTLPNLQLTLITEWRSSQLPSQKVITGQLSSQGLLVLLSIVGGIFLALAFWPKRIEAAASLLPPAEATVTAIDTTFLRFAEQLAAVIEVPHPKEFWAAFLKTVKTTSGASIVSSYRYSSASCSLIPEEHCGLEFQDQVAQRYWRESRIFLGAAKLLDRVESTEAFAKWNLTRLRFQPGEQGYFAFVPILHAKSGRFCMILFFETAEQQLAFLEQKPVFATLIRAATVLYEQKAQLLELTHAKTVKRSSEGATNHVRSEPPLS